MGLKAAVCSTLTAISDHRHPLPAGAIPIGRENGSHLVKGHRVFLTPAQIRHGIVIAGGGGCGLVEAGRLIVSRLLEAGRQVVLLSDYDGPSFYREFMDVGLTRELICLSHGQDKTPPDMGTGSAPDWWTHAISRHWGNADLVGLTFPSVRIRLSDSYLRQIMAWARKRWPGRVIVFVGWANDQVGPIADPSNTIMMFSNPCLGQRSRLSWRCRDLWFNLGGTIWMRWEGGEDAGQERSWLNAGEAIAKLDGYPVSPFRFDYSPRLPGALENPYPFVVIPDVSGIFAEDRKLLEARFR